MADSTVEINLARYKVARRPEDDTPFCLAQVSSYETDDQRSKDKISDLLEGRIVQETDTVVERACNLGGCTLKIVEDTESGKTTTGGCKAASYCLKVAFEAVGNAPSVDDGRALYKDIVDTLEGAVSKYSAGNFCPRLNCGLSAGVSVDQIPGTAGDCIAELTASETDPFVAMLDSEWSRAEITGQPPSPGHVFGE